jgi:hypothetical protein
MHGGQSLQLLVQTQRPELPSEQRAKDGQAACERVSKRLPAKVRASANVGCDIGLISLRADAGQAKKLCADRDVSMLTEDQPVLAQ